MARSTDNCGDDATATLAPGVNRADKEGREIPVSNEAGGSGVRVLRLPMVCRMTGLARSTIYRMQAERQFPQRVRLGMRAVGWIEQEVQEWLANCIENRL
jgi:prophage regulatory protein